MKKKSKNKTNKRAVKKIKIIKWVWDVKKHEDKVTLKWIKKHAHEIDDFTALGISRNPTIEESYVDVDPFHQPHEFRSPVYTDCKCRKYKEKTSIISYIKKVFSKLWQRNRT